MNSRVLIVFTVAMLAMVVAYPYPQDQALNIPHHGPDGYAKDKYFQYINVPAEKVFEWGYRRGNDPKHFREEYLSQKDHTFKAKVKWGDAHEGYGEHFYDYNHGPQYKKDEYHHSEPVHHEPAVYKPIRR
ncbi:hypothetical protein TCAL_00152 [Tigriopus californicus]|uniref:Uncharacterized protein n=2 Tax=Tigriopus californicus TaxID=6832 RepID=A0A553PG98_TIGCA|nr:hypothetical protein TCAL_00152 [Tigriopus californicus]